MCYCNAGWRGLFSLSLSLSLYLPLPMVILQLNLYFKGQTRRKGAEPKDLVRDLTASEFRDAETSVAGPWVLSASWSVSQVGGIR